MFAKFSVLSGALVAALTFLPISVRAQEPAKTEETVEIKIGERKVGDSLTTAMTMEMGLDINISMDEGSQSMKQKVSVTQKSKATILEMKDGKTTKLQLEFKEVKTKMEMEGLPEGAEMPEMENPLDGKTFVISKTDEGLKITDSEGNEADSEAVKEVMQQFVASPDQLNLIDPTVAHLSKSPLTLGRTIKVPNEALNGAFSDMVKFDKYEITAKEKSKHFGRPVVNCDIVMEGEGGAMEGMKMSMKLKGTQRIALDPGHTAELSVEGPIEADMAMEAEEMPFKMTMTGSMKMSQVSFFESAKKE